MEDDPVDPALVAQVDDLKKQFTFLSHQMSAIAAKLAAPPCPCATCAAIGPQFLQGLSLQPHLQHARAACLANGAAAAAAARTTAAPAVKQSAPSENGSSSGDEIKEVPHTNGTPAVNGHHLPNGTPLTPVLLQTTANLYAGWGAENNPHGGRKSKHCTPEQKIAVAEYAAVHGAANAARKFDIPPSVAAYYHRKLAKAKQIDATAAVLGASVLQKTEDGSPVVDLSMLAPSPDVRQRGRPKMIGDKLDADLMEFMIKAKADNPQLQNLRPEVALEMARAYIANHSPTKLKENGGHIDLKLSWAQKLVSRIAERESEIALGLPHGSLSNGGLKQLVNININDLLALATAMPSTEGEEPMNESNTDIAMPEITSGKELSLDDFLGVGGKLVEDDDDLMPVAQIE